MSHDYICYKLLHGLRFLAPNKYEIDLLNEALNIDFGPEAAKISKVKFGGRKKYLSTQPTPGAAARTGRVGSQKSKVMEQLLLYVIMAQGNPISIGLM